MLFSLMEAFVVDAREIMFGIYPDFVGPPDYFSKNFCTYHQLVSKNPMAKHQTLALGRPSGILHID